MLLQCCCKVQWKSFSSFILSLYTSLTPLALVCTQLKKFREKCPNTEQKKLRIWTLHTVQVWQTFDISYTIWDGSSAYLPIICLFFVSIFLLFWTLNFMVIIHLELCWSLILLNMYLLYKHISFWHIDL